MSTSPSLATQGTGKCVVCGDETVTRCSACAENGTEWMFFCSIDHQKLIWPAHERICGVRSNPYHWPGFNSKEIEDMVKLCVMPIRPILEEGKVMKSWLEMMVRNNPGELPPIEGQLQAVQHSFEIHREPSVKERALPLAETAEIVSIRSNAYAFSISSREYLKRDSTQALGLSDKSTSESPFNVLAHTQGILDYNLRQNPEFASWWSEYQHKSLIHMCLFAQTIKEPHSDEIWECMLWSKRNLMKFCEEVVKETHPNLARNIVENLVDASRYDSAKGLAELMARLAKMKSSCK